MQVVQTLEDMQGFFARADARAEQARLDKLEADARAEQARKDALAVQQAQLEQSRRLLALLAETLTRNKLSAFENG